MRTFYYLVLFASSTFAATHTSQSIKPSHTQNFAANSQRPRRIQGSIEHKRVSFPNNIGFRNNSNKAHSKRNGVPPYAVQMEPLVQYSQPDPLYTIEKQYISEAKLPDVTDNDLIKKPFPNPIENDVTENESISRVGTVSHGRLRSPPRRSPPPLVIHHQPLPQQIIAHAPQQVAYVPYGVPPPYYEEQGYEEPEPIIEIIIKESNISLPAPPPPPTPPPPKRTKEPVQVFYVKYKKDPYGTGDKVIYDAPVPAVTPPANRPESEEHTEPPSYTQRYEEEVTSRPLPSTTLKAIIRPDSETFHAAGVHITFGEPQDTHYGPYKRGDLEQQSAPQPAVAFPTTTHEPKPQISRSSTVGETSQLTKRNPAPFNPQPTPFQQNFQPTSPSFQKTPEFPRQDFQPPPVNQASPHYSTLPQHFQFQASQTPFTPFQPSNQQRYHTINNPPPLRPLQQPQQQQQQQQQQPQLQQQHQHQQHQHQQQQQQLQQHQHQQQQLQQHQQQPQQQLQQLQQSQSPQYHTINQTPLNLPPANFRPFPTQPPQINNPFHHQRAPIRVPQEQQQVEQVNRLQQQQQNLQQQIIQQYHHQQQQIQFRPQQPPQLQYPVDIVKAVENPNVPDHSHEGKITYTPKPSTITSQYFSRTTTTTTTEISTPEIVTEDPRKVAEEKKKKEDKQKLNIANLPSEVPDDLREQLLSSGILSNADIQILDYDKIGDIPIENLPPEALAGFQQASGSERREQVVIRSEAEEEDSASSSSNQQAVRIRASGKDADMEMKVVRFGPGEDDSVADRYVRKDATQLAPVVLNDSKYNRYLPLKVAGAQFPVPDELKGRNVTSVVVLAPVDYEFLTRHDDDNDDSREDSRVGRSATPVLEVQGVHFVAGDVLKALVRRPTTENYRRWLQKENSTSAERQSVVLLVVEPSKTQPEKEIFMYDIASGRVSKLRGELSSTFVKVAESNSSNQDLDEISDSAAGPGGDFTVKETSQVIARSLS